MSITVLNLTEASALLRTINKRDIKDVRAIDLDLALVLESGHKIIISRGAVAAVNSPQLMLEFADGDVALGDVFEKLNHIEVPADAAVTVTSKEITRYGIKRVVKPKVARNKQDQEADKDKTDEETAASPDTEEARPAEALAGNDGSGGSRSGDSGGSDITASKFTSGKGSSSSLAIQDVADAPADIGSSKGGISWPVIVGGLGLLAAAGGGGGGGGAAAPGAGSGSGTGIAATLSGAAALGPLNNATITAYDAEGRVIGKAVPVINGRYTLVLDQSGYKGLILLAIRDNTPGVADNYADEASVRMTDLGNTVLRAVALADGSNQVINVTALTELAALKAGLGTGQTNLAAAQVGATTVTGANAAVSNLFTAPLTFPAVLTKNEQAIPTLPAGFTAASLLQAIRGISAEWGGKGVSGDGNTSIGSLKSYQMFDKLGTGTTSFSLLQQGSSLDTLGAWLRLGLKPAATAGLNNVALEMLGGFKRNGVDQYKVSPDLETGLSDVGLANIGLLYQLSVANTSSRPVIRVRFDSSNNVAGNVIELYEGGRLVGSKTLVASDLGGGPKEVDVAVFQSLSAGRHDLEVRYTDTGGNSVNSNLSVNVAAGGAPVTLSDLGVRGSKQSASEAQSLGQSGASYAVISDADTSFASGHGNQGPVFVGTVGGGSASDRYLVTIQMGGKVVAFEDVGAGSFAIGIPAGVLPPGYYQDLSISATVLTPGARLGQTTSMQGLKLGWYWAAQAGTSIVGGNGNDELVLGAAADPEIVGGIRVQTGAGDDRITVGSFGKTSGLKATVTDFTVGMDRVKVFGQIVNPDFVKNYVTASDLNGSTQLQIDLDGAGAGKLYYHLTLQGVQYTPSTIGSIFGV
ncbi:hypothetical protein [Herbaspirillum huttiense]|uniref:hypothetical protein n=2 Tax=Pseudomonadota TaxID=1224 RepID=UPI002E782A94|nr:hypothetical protein [Herbaspirillum huttiense]MEE1637034.1 hypothetical protein [Herbaspirillum huttiense NC40101]